MKPLLFPCLLAAAIFLAPAQELPALKWTNRDQQSLMRGAWWNANPPLLPPVDAAAVPSSPMPEPAANADSPPWIPFRRTLRTSMNISCRTTSAPPQA
ncbi:hypothetical protein M5E88_09460 [Akkermansia muciniphila]|nr:hypothetical protein M5E88_09460 [Akkermansia muciniphila]